MKFNKSFLGKFSVNAETATKGGVYPPILEKVVVKKVFDAEEKKFTNEVREYQCQAFFYGLGRERILIKLPADAMSEERAEELQAMLEKGEENQEEVEVEFKDLKIFLGERTVKVGDKYQSELYVDGRASAVELLL